MTKQLDLLDIQGNVVRAYGRFGDPVARYVFLHIHNSDAGRKFVGEITKKVTTSVNWGNGPSEVPQPNWTVNIAFTYLGLKQLELPTESLIGFSPEFVGGMKKRQHMLGDDGPSSPEHWDPIWRENREERSRDVHIFISLNARLPALLEESYAWLKSVVAQYQDSVAIMGGHLGEDNVLMDYQDVKIVMENGKPTAKEHFGYTDGISDPSVEGMPESPEHVRGRGKQMADGAWAQLATGEFLLGHIDEAKEYPPAPNPILLSRNGTYMVYRKLHENVATFDAYLDEHGKKYPGGKELLAAKFVGRWRDNGAPLVRAPDQASKDNFDAEFAAADDQGKDKLLSDYTYDQDMSGAKCPFSAHVRRINPRASLEFIHDAGDTPGSLKVSTDAYDTPGALTNRRRLLRRGLPYGDVRDRTKIGRAHV